MDGRTALSRRFIPYLDNDSTPFEDLRDFITRFVLESAPSYEQSFVALLDNRSRRFRKVSLSQSVRI